jgi:hypothetical protein
MRIQITEYKTAAVQIVQRGLTVGLWRINSRSHRAASGRDDALSGAHLWGIGIPELALMYVVLALGNEIIRGGPWGQVIAMKIHHGFHFV